MGALWDAGWSIETIIPLVRRASARSCGAGQRLPRDPARAALAGGHHRHAGALPGARLRRARRQGRRRASPAATTDLRDRTTVPGTPIPYPVALFVVLAVVSGVVLHATGVGRSLFAIGAQRGGRVLRRHPGRAHQALAVRRLRRGRRPSPGSSTPCATPAPAPTTAPASSWPSSPPCCSAAFDFGGGGARSAASSPASCCSASCATCSTAQRRADRRSDDRHRAAAHRLGARPRVVAGRRARRHRAATAAAAPQLRLAPRERTP